MSNHLFALAVSCGVSLLIGCGAATIASCATAKPATTTSAQDMTAGDGPAAMNEVWIQLDLPPLAELAADDPQGDAHRKRLETQHKQVANALTALGGQVIGEVMITHNRIAARVPGAAIQSLRQTPGVRAVQPLTHRNRVDPTAPQRQ